jgi:hypothetical protein
VSDSKQKLVRLGGLLASLRAIRKNFCLTGDRKGALLVAARPAVLERRHVRPRPRCQVEFALQQDGTNVSPSSAAGGPGNNFFNLNRVEFGGAGVGT